jgi:hypothetical protein
VVQQGCWFGELIHPRNESIPRVNESDYVPKGYFATKHDRDAGNVGPLVSFTGLAQGKSQNKNKNQTKSEVDSEKIVKQKPKWTEES